MSGRGRYFTDAARAAALAVRKANALLPKSDGVEVFIVRGPDDKTFSWEIRRFGGVVLVQGEETFPIEAEALAAGRQALALYKARIDRASESDGTRTSIMSCGNSRKSGSVRADLEDAT